MIQPALDRAQVQVYVDYRFITHSAIEDARLCQGGDVSDLESSTLPYYLLTSSEKDTTVPDAVQLFFELDTDLTRSFEGILKFL